MSAQGQQPSPVMQADEAAVANALLWAIQRAAEKGSSAEDTREQDEAADAALKFAQAYVVLNPLVDQNGVPLAHHQAMASAQAPAPARSGQARTG